ncbi:MAG: GNAT family N-acetyltransferase [Lachnospiraceae bacterium]|nr:GNAT family N-acetyltransferase [Lachnospiraceae bacterium]
MNTPTLETERLILRKFTEQDMEALFLILQDREVNQFLLWYPVKNMENAKRFYEERYAVEYAQPQAYAYAICLKEDNSIINIIFSKNNRRSVYIRQMHILSGFYAPFTVSLKKSFDSLQALRLARFVCENQELLLELYHITTTRTIILPFTKNCRKGQTSML